MAYAIKCHIIRLSAILSSLGALGPGPCGGPPKTIMQLFGGPLKLSSIIRLGGEDKTGTFGQKWGTKPEHNELSLFSGPNLAFLAIFEIL